MKNNYKPNEQNQPQFILVDFKSQIHKNTFEYTLNYLIDTKLDLSAFDSEYKNWKTGASAYDPRVMLKIIFYAYSLGIIKSRRIERACKTDIRFMALSGNSKPDHSTITRFISSCGKKADKIFTDILMLCDDLGLIGKNMFAIDGCKISSNASKEWSGKLKDFKRKKEKMQKEITRLLKKHKELDEQNEDENEQLEKEKQAIKNYEKRIDKLTKFMKDNNDRISAAGNVVQSNITDSDSAKLKSSDKGTMQGYNAIATVDDKNQIIVDAQAIGSVNEREAIEPMLNNVRDLFGRENLKDTKLTADAGFSSEKILEYLEEEEFDAYIPDKDFRKRDVKFIGREAHKERYKKKQGTWKTKYFGIQDFKYDKDSDQLICPARETLFKRGKPFIKGSYTGQRYSGRETKCPDCKLRPKCIRGSKNNIKQIYINLSKELSGDEKSYLQKMREKLDSITGSYIYSKRMGTAEPPFAHIFHLMRLRYFTVRNKLKVNAQWKLYSTLYNMKKLFKLSPMFA